MTGESTVGRPAPFLLRILILHVDAHQYLTRVESGHGQKGSLNTLRCTDLDTNG
jgi:hypothetical protein